MVMFYALLWWLILPLALCRLWWRGRKEPGYRARMGERLGFYGNAGSAADAPAQKTIWIHAVSVGETRAAQPLVRALLQRYPACHIVLTCMTATGRETGRQLFSDEPRVRQSWLPYDMGWILRRFIQHFQPALCVLMETEVWPQLILQCHAARIPVALVSARLSQRSLRRAQRLPAFFRHAARKITLVAAQTEADAQRFRAYAQEGNIQVTGNIKFDVAPPEAMLAAGAALRARINAQPAEHSAAHPAALPAARPVLLCASTRQGEEALLLDAWARADMGDALLVVTPRHPQRFDEVFHMASERGLAAMRRSQLDDAADAQTAIPPETRVLIGDTMGEMYAYYAACDAAFIGGSLLPMGGQNLIEACAVGRPVLIGPHTFNFDVISQEAVAAGAAVRVRDADDLMQQARRLLRHADERTAMSARAALFAQQHRGATERTLTLLEPLL